MMEKGGIIGLTEKVIVYSGDKKKKKRMMARIDTGATKSSIDLSIASKLQLGPIIKTKEIRSASGKSMRPIIKILIEIRKRKIWSYMTIADRAHMKYRVLIGQKTLKKLGYLIDPRKK